MYDPDKLREQINVAGFDSIMTVTTLGIYGVVDALLFGNEENIQDAFLNMALLNVAVKGKTAAEMFSVIPDAELQALMSLASQ